MTTFTELQAQMTGPGGPFETQTEVIDTGLGEVEMTMYAQRFGDLRQVAQFAALAHGDKEFIVYGDRRITFAEFFAQANTISAALLAAGVVKGDRVAVLSQNNPEWCLTFWATVNIGAVLVGLNGWWTTDEILYGLDLMPDGRRKADLSGRFAAVLRRAFSSYVLPFDDAAAVAYARIRGDRDRAGRPISVNDAMIAAIARTQGATVATRNVADFEHCDLAIINPWDG